MTEKHKQLSKFALRILITTGLLAFVFVQIDFSQFFKSLNKAIWPCVLAAWFVVILSIFVQSFKLRYILKKQDFDSSILSLFRVSAISFLYSLVIPGPLATGVKWYMLKKNTGKGATVLSSMVYNQYTDLAVILVFGLSAIIAFSPTATLTPDSPRKYYLPVAAGVMLLIFILFSSLLFNKRFGNVAMEFSRKLLKLLPHKFRKDATSLLEQVAFFQIAGFGFHATSVLLSIIGSLIPIILMYYFSAMAAHIQIGLGLIVWISALVYILGRLPISIANLGVREMTLVEFLKLYGVEPSSAFLMSMIIFSCIIIMAAIGAVYQVAWAFGPKPRQ
jgi:uncharacterized membrane protein YbhN (UPF0104 family)